MNRFQKSGARLRGALTKGQRAGQLEGLIGRVHLVLLAVDQTDAESGGWEPRQHPIHGRAAHALFDRRDKVARDRAAANLIQEFDLIPAARHRLQHNRDIAELPVPARLAFEAPVGGGRLCQGLLVRDLRRRHVHLGAEFLLDLLEGDVHVRIAHAPQQRLAGGLVTHYPEGRIFLGHAMQGGAQLVYVRLRARRNCQRHVRLREVDARDGRAVLVGYQGVAGKRVGQLGDRTNVSGHDGRNLGVLSPHRAKHMPHALVGSLVDVVRGGVGRQFPRQHLQERLVPQLRVHDGLEGQRRQLAVTTFQRLGGIGQEIHDRVQNLARAQVFGARHAQQRENRALADAGVEGGLHLRFRDLFIFQVFLSQFVIDGHDRVQQLVALGAGDVQQLRRAVHYFAFRVGELDALQPEQVHNAGEAGARSVRQLHRRNRSESLAQTLDHPGEFDILAIHAVQHEHHRQLGLAGELPRQLGADLDPRLGVDDDHGGVGHSGAGEDLTNELRVAGHVDQVDL